MADANSKPTLERLRSSQDQIARYLDRGHRPQAFRYDPVRIKNLEKVAGGLQQLVTMLAKPSSNGAQPDNKSLDIFLDRLGDPAALSGHNAWELADLMVIELIERGDDVYLYSLLQASDSKDDVHRWSAHLPVADLERLRSDYKNGAFATDAARRETRRFLEQLQQFRIDEYRRDRAKAELRGIYLGRMVVALLAVALVFVVAYIGQNQTLGLTFRPADLAPGWIAIFLVASAGAMGSILSRAIKLGRSSFEAPTGPAQIEHPLGIRALIAAWKLFLAQIGIGAAAGLMLYIVLQSGIIAGMATTNAARVSLLAFLAGFSEPFFIGILDKVAGTSTKP